MKKMLLYIVVIAISCLSFFQSAKHYIALPKHFPAPYYDIEKSEINPQKIELGRRLFYDPILSADSTISCASCHSPYNSFAHTDHDLSHGIADQIGIRNAPALINLAWQPIFMWDGAINHIDVQALAPISHPKEMGENIRHIVEKLSSNTIYKTAFRSAFGDTTISGTQVLKALAQFQLSLVSAASKYDSVMLHKSQFTMQEEKGYQLFLLHCNSCHTAPLFTNFSFQNNGLSVDTTLNDIGRYAITKNSSDSFRFKVPTLRNLSYTYPYMHDGRYKKLYEIVRHYTTIDTSSPYLSARLKTTIALSPNEQVDLIAFLLTLNDRTFVFNTKFAHPKN